MEEAAAMVLLLSTPNFSLYLSSLAAAEGSVAIAGWVVVIALMESSFSSFFISYFSASFFVFFLLVFLLLSEMAAAAVFVCSSLWEVVILFGSSSLQWATSYNMHYFACWMATSLSWLLLVLICFLPLLLHNNDACSTWLAASLLAKGNIVVAEFFVSPFSSLYITTSILSLIEEIAVLISLPSAYSSSPTPPPAEEAVVGGVRTAWMFILSSITLFLCFTSITAAFRIVEAVEEIKLSAADRSGGSEVFDAFWLPRRLSFETTVLVKVLDAVVDVMLLWLIESSSYPSGAAPPLFMMTLVNYSVGSSTLLEFEED